MRQPHPERGIEDAGSAVSSDDTSSSSDLCEESEYEFDSNYDLLWD